jgi:dipeptidase E
MRTQQIVAMGGGGFSMEPDNPLLDDFVLSLARRRRKPSVCFVATASGDSDNYVRRFYDAFPPTRAVATYLPLFHRGAGDLTAVILKQDVIYVGGGNTANMLAVWRLHGVERALRAAWNAGVVLAGISAGAICWFEAGITDSFGPSFRELNNGLGFLKGACCPHYDGEPGRRPVLHRLLRRGFQSCYAIENGAALHFVGRRLSGAVSSTPGKRAFRVALSNGGIVETPLPIRFLGKQPQ